MVDRGDGWLSAAATVVVFLAADGVPVADVEVGVSIECEDVDHVEAGGGGL